MWCGRGLERRRTNETIQTLKRNFDRGIKYSVTNLVYAEISPKTAALHMSPGQTFLDAAEQRRGVVMGSAGRESVEDPVLMASYSTLPGLEVLEAPRP